MANRRAEQVNLRQAAAALHVSHDALLHAVHSGALRATQAAAVAGATIRAPFQTTPAALAAYVRHAGPDLKWTTMGDLSRDLPRFRFLPEIAAETGLSLWWLQEGCRTRTLPCIKVGRKYQMSEADVHAAIDIARAAKDATPDELVAERAHAARTRRRRPSTAAA